MAGLAYIRAAFALNCFADVHWFFASLGERSMKEFTESFACFRAVIEELKLDTKDPNIDIYVVSDGVKARTGAIFAHMTKWTVLSIDPLLRMDEHQEYADYRRRIGNPIQRLTLWPFKVEDCMIKDTFIPSSTAVIVLPHAHAPFDACLRLVKDYETVHCVAMPCCTPIPPRYLSKSAVNKFNVKTYLDENVHSPKNMMHIWHNIKAV